MPPPTSVSALRSFLLSVQFYGKFILSTLTELATFGRLDLADGVRPSTGGFPCLKVVLCTDTVPADFNQGLVWKVLASTLHSTSAFCVRHWVLEEGWYCFTVVTVAARH